jgi:hypothetical protein
LQKISYLCAQIICPIFHQKIINIMQQTLEEIKRQYPDEWLILGSPVKNEAGQKIIAAELLYHSPNQLELVHMDKPLMKEHKRHAILFNRVTRRNVFSLIGMRTVCSIPAPENEELVTP